MHSTFKASLMVATFVLIFYNPLSAQEQSKINYLIDSFENDSIGMLPANWYDRDTNFRLLEYDKKVQLTYKYTVLQDTKYQNKYLRYDGTLAMHINYPLANKTDVDIYQTPILSWKWRVFDIPNNANEDNKDKNDVAASIYVVFDFGHVLFRKVPKSIRYTWSSTLPVGTELSKFYGNQKIIVMAAGEEGLGSWQSFERNILEDYQRLFGENPPARPLAILLLSDGDDTNDRVIADYDDIVLKSPGTN